MIDLNTAQTKAAAAYNAASDLFDHPANTFWDRFGRNTINRLDLKPGASVLDVCCGSGASALPAAEQVGHNGHVIGIDVAEKLLDLAPPSGTGFETHTHQAKRNLFVSNPPGLGKPHP